MQTKLVIVHAFASQAEADLAKSILESAGIDAMIQADRAGGMRDHLAWSGFGFKILVREEDAAVAREALDPTRRAPEGKLAVVQIFGTRYEAEIAQGALDSAGIPAAIETVLAGDKSVPSSLGEPLFRVVVRGEDTAAAREVLDASRD